MKKGFWISLIAGIAAVAAVAVAVAALIRRKTNAIAQELDFEPDDDYFDPADNEDEFEEEAEEAAEEAEKEASETDAAADVATSAHEEPMDIPEKEE